MLRAHSVAATDRPTEKSTDGGVAMSAFFKNAWSITRENPSDIVREGEIIDNVQGAFMLELVRGSHMRTGAKTFANAFDTDLSRHAFAEATFQLFLLTVERLQAKYAERRLQAVTSSASASRGEPFKMYLEAVAAASADARMPAIAYERFTNEDGSAAGSPAAMRCFMRHVPDNVPVIAYRLWFFVCTDDPTLDFSREFLEIIKGSQSAYEAHISSTGKGANALSQVSKDGEVGISMSSYAPGGAGTSYGHMHGPTQKWRRIRSFGMWATAVDSLLMFEALTPHLDTITSAGTSPVDNPASPRYALAPRLFFENQLPNVDYRQRCYDNYLRGSSATGTRWGFAFEDRVVRVRSENMNIVCMRAKMPPDYQIRIIGDAPFDDAIRRRRAAETRYLRRAVAAAPSLEPARAMDEDGSGGGRRAAIAAAADDDDDDDFTAEEALEMRAIMSAQLGPHDGLGVFGLPPPSADLGGGRAGIEGGKTLEAVERVLAKLRLIEIDPDDDEEALRAPANVELLEREEFESTDSASAQALLRATDDESLSDFHLVRALGRRLRAELVALVNTRGGTMSRAEARERYLDVQARVLHEHEALCMERTSLVTGELRAMNAWFLERVNTGRGWLSEDEPALDAELSTFGNLIARRMHRLDACENVTFLHFPMLIALFASWDAYRHALNMHLNYVYWGPPETGKSFIVVTMTQMLIPGTTTRIDDESANASYTDEVKNDRIIVAEEVNPENFRESAHGGSDKAEAKIKQGLTSQCFSKLVFYKGADGRRLSRLATSQAMSTFFGCMNASPTTVSSAIQTRISWVHVVQTRRAGTDTADLQHLSATAEQQARRAKLLDRVRCEQFLHAHVEKAIAEGALTDVTLAACAALRQTVRRRLKLDHGISLSARFVSRATWLLRKLVISTRLAHLYSSPASPYFRADFDVYQLAALDPLLYDDEEMACFALQALKHELADSKERANLSALLDASYTKAARKSILDKHPRSSAASDDDRSVWQSAVGVLMREVYLLPQTEIRGARGIDMSAATTTTTTTPPPPTTASGSLVGAKRKIGVAAAPPLTAANAWPSAHVAISPSSSSSSSSSSGGGADDVLVPVLPDGGGGGGGGGGGSAPADAPMVAEQAFEKSPEYLYAYRRFPGALGDIARRISAASAKTSASVQFTVDEVERALTREMRKYVHSAQYTWDVDAAEPVVNRAKPRVVLPMAIRTHDAFFIMNKFFSDVDPLTDAIAYARSTHADVRRKYVTAEIVDDNHPHYLKSVYVGDDDKDGAAGSRPRRRRPHRVVDYSTQRTASAIFSAESLVPASAHAALAALRASSSSASSSVAGVAAALGINTGRKALDAHYNDLSRRERARTLFLDEHACSVEHYERYEREPPLPRDDAYGRRRRRYVLDWAGPYPEYHMALDGAPEADDVDDAVVDPAEDAHIDVLA